MKVEMNIPDMATPAEVADALNISRSMIYSLLKRGELPAYKLGKDYRIHKTDIEKYLEGRYLNILNKKAAKIG